MHCRRGSGRRKRRRRAEGAGLLGRGFPLISSLHRGAATREREDGPSPAAWECRCGRDGALFFFLSFSIELHPRETFFSSSFSLYFYYKYPVFRLSLVFDHVLAEVVVCAVGWVVTLPAMEMTAQATALLVLVPSLQPLEEGERKKSLCSHRC